MNQISGYGEFKLGDKTVPVKIGTNAYRLFCEQHGIGLSEMKEYLNSPMAVVELFYFGYVTAQRMKNELVDINIDTFVELCGDTDGVIDDFGELLKTAKIWGKSIEDLTDKKKVSQ